MSGDDYLPELANSLVTQAWQLLSTGRSEEALAPAREAVAVHHRIARSGLPHISGAARSRAVAHAVETLVLARLVKDADEWRVQASTAAWMWLDLALKPQDWITVSALFLLAEEFPLSQEAGEQARRAHMESASGRPVRLGSLRVSARSRLLSAMAGGRSSRGESAEARHAAARSCEEFEEILTSRRGAPADRSLLRTAETVRDQLSAELPALSPAVVVDAVQVLLAETVSPAPAHVAPEDSLRLHRRFSELSDHSGLHASVYTSELHRLHELVREGRREEAIDGLPHVLDAARLFSGSGRPSDRHRAVQQLLGLRRALWEGQSVPTVERPALLALLRAAADSATGQGEVAGADALATAATVQLAEALLDAHMAGDRQGELDEVAELSIEVLRRCRGVGELRQVSRRALRCFAAALEGRHAVSGDVSGLDEAVAALYELWVRPAVARTDDEPPDTEGSEGRSDAAEADEGRGEDLEWAIRLARMARSYASPRSARQHTQQQWVLALLLHLSYGRTGDRLALAEGSDLLRRLWSRRDVSASQPSETPLNSADVALCLVTSLLQLWQETGDDGGDEHLDEAGRVLRVLAAEESGPHARLTSAAAHLAAVLLARSRERGRPADLRKAADHAFIALHFLPPEDAEQPGLLALAAVILLETGILLADGTALDEAVGFAHRAVDAAPADAGTHAQYVVLLAHCLAHRGALSENEDDLVLAARYAAEASGRASAHPEARRSAVALEQLLPFAGNVNIEGTSEGQGSGPRGRRSADAREAHPPTALTQPDALPAGRLRTDESLGRDAMAAGLHDLAVKHYTRALKTLRLLLAAGLEGTGAPGAAEAGSHDHLVNDAVASAVAAGRLERAVELFEYGRAALLAHAPGPDPLLTRLDRTDPGLSQRFRQISRRIANEDAGRPEGAAPPAPGRVELAAEWKDTVARVRRLPGFRKLLSPPEFRHLAASFTTGPIVMVNVSRFRSDALILADGAVTAVALPNLDQELPEMLAAFRSALEVSHNPLAEGLPGEGRLRSTLRWLWHRVTGPVLAELERRGALSSGDDPPRMWWITTGLLGLLPLHAAQDDPGEWRTASGDAPSDSALDRVCSSYAVTIEALAAAHKSSPATGPARALVVAPGASDTEEGHAAEREALNVVSQFDGWARTLTGQGASEARVVSALRDASLMHLAGHGAMESGESRFGTLLLADGPLSIDAVCRARSDDARLAVVSGCETAFTGPDGHRMTRSRRQALSLPMALHHGGFHHAVGTLWNVGDRTQADFAALFYERLFTAGPRAFGNTAYAVRDVQRLLRARYRHVPSVWACYVHVGP
ncbi:CHAT domain-containing protein [Streptomyces bobili]|uniref:CHAT domain-containing protein n=1 Tax=Streptomyces bobili TaxID=67280 RepID=UPI003788A36B